MQYCPSCRMHIAGDKRCCPLCGGKLEGAGDPQSEIFPELAPYRSVARRVLRILALTGAGATAVCIVINLLVGTAVWWSLDFVFPCVCATGLLMEIALGLIMKMPVYAVAGPLGALGLAGLVPGVLALLGRVQIVLPSVLCTGFSLLFLAGLLLSHRRTAWGEFRRRFHM